jgi:preprotein translocase subunit SecG
MLYNILLIVQILTALGIIGLVLIQHGKGADAGAAFGGGASGTVFGSKGSGNFLTKLTTGLAALFFANSLMLAWLVAHPDGASGSSIIPTQVVAPTEGAPANNNAPVVTNTTPVDVPGGAASTEAPAAAAPKPTTTESPSDIPK